MASIGKINPFKSAPIQELSLVESLRPLLGDNGVALMETHTQSPALEAAQTNPEQPLSFDPENMPIEKVYNWLKKHMPKEDYNVIRRGNLLMEGEHGLTYRADLKLDNRGIQTIPKELNKIMGSFNLSGNKISHLTHFPDHVIGNVDLSDNPLLGLRGLSGCTIGGNLRLVNTFATVFPENVTVGQRIVVSETLAARHPNRTKVKRAIEKLLKSLHRQNIRYFSSG